MSAMIKMEEKEFNPHIIAKKYYIGIQAFLIVIMLGILFYGLFLQGVPACTGYLGERDEWGRYKPCKYYVRFTKMCYCEGHEPFYLDNEMIEQKNMEMEVDNA